MTEAQVQGKPARQARIGKRPVVVPKGVTVNVAGQKVDVQGPKGKLSQVLPDGIDIKKDGEQIVVTSSAPGGNAPRLQGLGRALIASMVQGAAQGYERSLELVGTGYRAEVKGQTLTMQVGKSHPAVFELPKSVSVTIPPDSKGTILILSSADKAVLGQVAASIRSMRPPEPYGGKGVRYRGEQIRRKAGKAGKGRK